MNHYSSSLDSNLLDISSYLKDTLTTYLNRDQAAIALGMTFGIKDLLTPELYRLTKTIGVTHMMVLSGANISMFITSTESALSWLPKKYRVMMAIVFTMILLAVIPIQVSVIRAAGMSFATHIGHVLGRPTHRLHLLLLTSALMFIINPTILNDISFQLSFLAVFGITLFYNPIHTHDASDNIVKRIYAYIREQIQIGISAQVFTAPLIFYYFGSISLLSVLGTMMLSPFVTPLMILTILLVILHAIFPALAMLLGTGIQVYTHIMLWIITILGQLEYLHIQY